MAKRIQIRHASDLAIVENDSTIKIAFRYPSELTRLAKCVYVSLLCVFAKAAFIQPREKNHERLRSEESYSGKNDLTKRGSVKQRQTASNRH